MHWLSKQNAFACQSNRPVLTHQQCYPLQTNKWEKNTSLFITFESDDDDMPANYLCNIACRSRSQAGVKSSDAVNTPYFFFVFETKFMLIYTFH